MRLSRQDMEARYWIFQEAVLEDQRNYYRRTVDIYEKASNGVKFWRALMALIAGTASLMVSLIVLNVSDSTNIANCIIKGINPSTGTAIQATPATESADSGQEVLATESVATGQDSCSSIGFLAPILIIIATVAPAIAAAFATLADLYQWDRLSSIYKNAYRNLAVPDALSPDDEMDDEVYNASLQAYAEGTLRVIRDETSQWGQSVKLPEALQDYINQAQSRAKKE